jgi:hypothetical protein
LHPGTLQNVEYALTLGEKQTGRAVSDGDPKKVMKVSHVLHGELMLKRVDDTTKEMV